MQVTVGKVIRQLCKRKRKIKTRRDKGKWSDEEEIKR